MALGGGGITWSHQFNLRRFFFHFARGNCVLSEYPRKSNRFNDIFKTRARFWPGSPGEMTNPSLSPKQVGGSVRGVPWSQPFSAWRFFFHLQGETAHFLNIQKVLIG